MPMIIYDNYVKSETSLEFYTLHWLLTIKDNTNIGFVSEKRIKNNRKYPYFKRINGKSAERKKEDQILVDF